VGIYTPAILEESKHLARMRQRLQKSHYAVVLHNVKNEGL